MHNFLHSMLGVLVLTITVPWLPATPPAAVPATPATGRPAADQRPLAFEVNQGQADPSVAFLARGRGYHLFLTATEAVFTLRGTSPGARGQRDAHPGRPASLRGTPSQAARQPPRATVLRLQLVGANPQPQLVGLGPLPGTVNYVTGRVPRQWITQVPTYAQVTSVAVYPGVDLVYYGTPGQLEYDFYVAAGADPHQIILAFEGADTVEVDRHGELVLQTAAGTLRHRKPFLYQEIDGVRQEVAGGYVRTGERTVAFQVGRYDASRPLVIDPVIVYSTFVGGVSGDPYSHIDKDTGNDIAVDAAGNIYVVGATNALGRYDADVVVRKFNPSGSHVLYETYLDSNGTDDAGYGIAVDAAGNAYVTGQFGDPQLPGFAFGVLVAKLSPVGTPLYQVTFGADSPGYSQDFGARIAVDEAGNAYVVGTTYGFGTPFPTTPGAFQERFGGGLTDAFVVKLDPAGGFVYSTLLGGAGTDAGWGIALRQVDAVSHAYVIGSTGWVGDFPTTPGVLQPAFGGAADVFVTQLNASGSALVYSTYLGGNGRDQGNAIAVDAAGNAYLTGWTGQEPLDPGSHFPIVNAFQPTYGGAGGGTPAAANAFVAKLNPTGSALVYSSYMGGGGYELYDAGTAITVDGAGYTYLTGVTGTRPDLFTGERFPIVNAWQPEPGSPWYDDAFVAKLTPQGALVYSSYLGGTYEDVGYGIAVDSAGNVYVTGVTNSEDFPITPGAVQPEISGGGCSYTFQCPDAFVTKVLSD